MISVFDKIRRKMILCRKMTAGRLLFIVPHSVPQDKMQFVFSCGNIPSAPVSLLLFICDIHTIFCTQAEIDNSVQMFYSYDSEFV